MRAVQRAINEGTVEVLGGFHAIPPSVRSGWMLKITSKHKRTWAVAVTPNDITHTYQVWIADRVPWEKWAGDLYRNHPVYDGDDPLEYLTKYRETL
jgi:hypothetical protein